VAVNDEGSISVNFQQLFCDVALTFVKLVMMPFGTIVPAVKIMFR
jgi:hypothetical protein